jgi:hypothetical protein
MKLKPAVNVIIFSLWGICCAILGSVISTGAIANTTSDVIKAKKISIVDDKGKQRIVMGMEKEGPSISLFRGDGKKTIAIKAGSVVSNIVLGFEDIENEGRPNRKSESVIRLSTRKYNAFAGLSSHSENFRSFGITIDKIGSPRIDYQRVPSTIWGEIEFFCGDWSANIIKIKNKIDHTAIDLKINPEGSGIAFYDKEGLRVIELATDAEEKIKIRKRK